MSQVDILIIKSDLQALKDDVADLKEKVEKLENEVKLITRNMADMVTILDQITKPYHKDE